MVVSMVKNDFIMTVGARVMSFDQSIEDTEP